MIDAVVVLAQTLLLVLAAPAVVGYVRLLKARLQGRRGAGLLQPYFELRKTFGKHMVVADTASWIFHVAPFVLMAATVAAATLVPVVSAVQPADRMGDLFVLAALLMLGTVWLALAGLDPGTAFGGMGSSREMTVAALTEPTLAISVLALAFAAFVIALLAEAGRLPVDNPATHLELTMIHEAMVLEYSGPYLALVLWGSAVKMTLLLALAANVFLPWGLATSLAPAALAVGLAAIVLKLLVLGALLAVLETGLAKLRLFRVPELLAVSFTLALIAAASSFFTR
jgi:formate hydrogenlyase subunit 4